MESETLVETLEAAGLSPYQAAAYVALLGLGTASATEIADASDVPGPRIYDVLRSLADRGYVETYEQDTMRARAHDPGEVLVDLRGRADRLESAAEEIEDRWDQPELESNRASIVTRFETVIDRARLFVQNADNQIHLSVTPNDFERLSESLDLAHERGVKIELLVHTDPGEEPPPAAAFEGRCTEARHRDVPTPFVALVDRQNTCFSHHPESFDRYGVLVNDETHTFVFHWYFRTCLWEHADPIYTERNAEPPIEYVDVRQFLRELQPVLESDRTVTVTVTGKDLQSGTEREVTGTVESTSYAADTTHSDAPLQAAGQVTVVVDTGDYTVTTGGWGAVVEDIEATHIVVEDIDPPIDDFSITAAASGTPS